MSAAYIRGLAQQRLGKPEKAIKSSNRSPHTKAWAQQRPSEFSPMFNWDEAMPRCEVLKKVKQPTRFLRSLERRRPRHPHPEGSQGGVREAAIEVEKSCLVAYCLPMVYEIKFKV